MTENNAAQAIQEAERIAAADEYFKARAWIMDTNDNRRIFEAGFDRAYALLSKLRAEGVQAGDERLAAYVRDWATRQGWKPGDAEGAFQYAQRISYAQGMADARPYWVRAYVEQDDYDKAVAEAIERVSERVERSALASAPVAGEPICDLEALQWAEKHGLQWALKHPDGIREVIADAQSLAAPQTGAEPLARYCPGCGSVGPVGNEYRDCCPDGNQARMIPARLAEQCRDTFRLAIQPLLPDAAANEGAAPQASKVTRILFPTHLRKMWSGGEVQAWLDEHQGVTAPKPSAKGSFDRYQKWQAEQAADGAPPKNS